jgi:hypothetical protein
MKKRSMMLLFVYYKRIFSSMLCINDHQIQGYPNGPLDANGVLISLPMWVNSYYDGSKNASKKIILTLFLVLSLALK